MFNNPWIKYIDSRIIFDDLQLVLQVTLIWVTVILLVRFIILNELHSFVLLFSVLPSIDFKEMTDDEYKGMCANTFRYSETHCPLIWVTFHTGICWWKSNWTSFNFQVKLLLCHIHSQIE